MPDGAPKPWNQPFSAQSATDTHSSVENPIATLISADTRTPNAKNTRILA